MGPFAVSSLSFTGLPSGPLSAKSGALSPISSACAAPASVRPSTTVTTNAITVRMCASLAAECLDRSAYRANTRRRQLRKYDVSERGNFLLRQPEGQQRHQVEVTHTELR